MTEIFKYCPNCGIEIKQGKNSKLIICNNCGLRYYLTSYPTAGALLFNGKDELLLVKRKNEPFKNYWDIPGGFVELNENLENAIVRELMEELQIIATKLKYVGSVTDLYPYEGISYITLAAIYEGKISGKIKAGDDAVSYRFFRKKDFPKSKFAFPNLSKMIEKYLKI